MFVYYNLQDAIRDGFTVYDRNPEGYLMRRKSLTSGLWELAQVILRKV